jgi:hypothetical protein
VPQLAHALGKVLGERFFATEKVSRAGDVDPHRIRRGERDRGAVTERDFCQAAQRSLDFCSLDFGDH